MDRALGLNPNEAAFDGCTNRLRAAAALAAMRVHGMSQGLTVGLLVGIVGGVAIFAVFRAKQAGYLA